MDYIVKDVFDDIVFESNKLKECLVFIRKEIKKLNKEYKGAEWNKNDFFIYEFDAKEWKYNLLF